MSNLPWVPYLPVPPVVIPGPLGTGTTDTGLPPAEGYVSPLKTTAEAIKAECDALAAMLIDKNRRYGNSATEPLRIFSKLGTVEGIKVRLDDKLSRILVARDGELEDPILDLMGYLVLLRVAQAQAKARGY